MVWRVFLTKLPVSHCNHDYINALFFCIYTSLPGKVRYFCPSVRPPACLTARPHGLLSTLGGEASNSGRRYGTCFFVATTRTDLRPTKMSTQDTYLSHEEGRCVKQTNYLQPMWRSIMRRGLWDTA
jgi:hypothetical protein